METEMNNLESYPLLFKPWSSTAAAPAADTDVLRYTSLRDIMHPSPCSAWMRRYARGPLFVDSSAISIRNQLVKHAASAYLQSAVVLYSRNQSCLARLWARVRSGAEWNYYVQGPLSSCVECVVWTIRRIMAYVVGRLDMVWGGGGARTPIA